MAIKQTAGREALGKFAPKFAELNDDVLFGQVWSREDKLSLRDRSIVTVVALMAQGLTDSSFQYHLTTALNNGVTNDAFAKYFIGQSYLAPLSTQQIGIYNVTFEPGCRNNWHIHHAKNGGGQILICVAGHGYYQEWGKPAQELRPGDVVNIPVGVKHWHGAAARDNTAYFKATGKEV